MYTKKIEYVLKIIDEQRREWYKRPTKKLLKNALCFDVMVYKRWAIDELDRWVRIHYEDEGFSCLYTFKYMVGSFSKKGNDDTNLMFSLAEDVCQGLIDTVLAAGWID